MNEEEKTRLTDDALVTLIEANFSKEINQALKELAPEYSGPVNEVMGRLGDYFKRGIGNERILTGYLKLKALSRIVNIIADTIIVEEFRGWEEKDKITITKREGGNGTAGNGKEQC